MTTAEVATRIELALPGAKVEVEDYTGTGDHFRAVVEASQFSGHSLVAQHQMVYSALKEPMATEAIHALSLSTRAPE